MVRPMRWAALGVGALLAATLPVAARPTRTHTSPRVVAVQHGDSLWTLARQHGDPRRDVRDVVAEMMRVNAVDPGELQPGSTIVIPAHLLGDRQ
jgi:hypothetical protein